MLTSREEIETEIAAFVGSWLDEASELYPNGYSIGTFGFVFEVQQPAEEPGREGYAEIGYTCSDSRHWIQAALFRRAMLLAETGLEPDDGDLEDA